MFRDMLHTQYRSSAKAKTARRRVQIMRNKTQTPQQLSQRLIDGSEDSDNSSMSSSRLGSSTDSLGFDYSLELDFFSIEDRLFWSEEDKQDREREAREARERARERRKRATLGIIQERESEPHKPSTIPLANTTKIGYFGARRTSKRDRKIEVSEARKRD
jgi:hypothetical protein